MNFFKRLEKMGLCYNDNQKEAITYVNGPLLVVAGPGSGKTSVITARTAYLIQKANINPLSILVITFTRAAAEEMKSRFENFPGTTPEHTGKVEIGTFHSIFYKIISSYYNRHIRILNQEKACNAIKNTLRSLSLSADYEFIRLIQNEISAVRNLNFKPDGFESRVLPSSLFIKIYNSYQKYKQSAGYIDFDDILFICKDILSTDTNLLLKMRSKYKYILVDEFQDINNIQSDIINLLSYPLNNICVVGDDDQSIYGFRGSSPQRIIDFKQFYGNCRQVILDVNYRSTKEIVDFSEKVIYFNTKRIEKALRPARGSGESPVVFSPNDDNAQAAFIADTIEILKCRGFSNKDFAVLYRTNIQSRPVIDEFITRCMPFTVNDGINSFYNHWVCRDITSYLKLSINHDDISSLAQIINKPLRYMNRSLIQSLLKNSSIKKSGVLEYLENYSLSGNQKHHIDSLFYKLNTIQSMHPTQAVKSIRGSIGYNNYVKSYCLTNNIDFDYLNDILDEYEMAASGFRTINEFLYHIYNITSTLKACKSNNTYNKDSITLTSIHGAKGLEYPCVFIIGVIEGLLPHKTNIRTAEQIEEERRLLYVAITRCKNKLFLLCPKKYHSKYTRPSRFITEYMRKPLSETGKFYNSHLKIYKYIGNKIFNIQDT